MHRAARPHPGTRRSGEGEGELTRHDDVYGALGRVIGLSMRAPISEQKRAPVVAQPSVSAAAESCRNGRIEIPALRVWMLGCVRHVVLIEY